jgi:hypothetical protein
MTHDQIVAALQRGYQLDDARESRRGCYPIRKPAARNSQPMAVDPPALRQLRVNRGFPRTEFTR